MKGLLKQPSLVFCVFALSFYVFFANLANQKPDGYDIPTPKFLLPSFAAQIMSFGDPYLAANINYSRVVTLFHYSNDNVEPRSKLLVQSTELNPKHLDNMYQLGVIPWEGEVDRSLLALDRVTEARYWDWRPPFMYGITTSNFKRDHTLAADYINLASERADQEKRRLYLKTLAAGVVSKGDDVVASLNYVEGLMNSVKQQRLKDMLNARATRLKTLLILRDAAAEYEAQFDKPISSLDELLSSGILRSKPELGSGVGFDVDENGRVDFYERIHASAKR